MKNRNIALLLMLFTLTINVYAQDSEEEANELTISGSVDTYYKYDFSGQNQIPTSFAQDHSSISIGMLNLIASQEVGKASFVGDISFGPRGQGESLLNEGSNNYSFHIQNLYVAYQLSEKVTVTGGYMGTFVGYEVISPASNFNYSTSYLFTNGPFQNAGIKFDFALSDQFGLMVGVFNDWNNYRDATSSKDLGVQLSYSPADGMDIYLNLVTGEDSGTELDLTAGLQLSDNFYLGANAATYSANEKAKLFNTAEDTGFIGLALYPQLTLSESASVGLRYENFTSRVPEATGDNLNINSFTVSGNIGSGSLKFIPELRYDAASADIFTDSDGDATGGAFQFLMAAVFSF